MPKIYLKNDKLEKINHAVKKAERQTSGEIAIAFIKESYNYAFYELIFAVLCGFVYFFTLMFFSTSIEKIIQNMFWEYSSSYLLIFYGFSTFLVIFIFYFIANAQFIDRLIIPRSVMRRKVNERAARYFTEAGIFNTRERTGILIFISLMERRVELLADKGINKKISQEQWTSIVNHIVEGVKLNKFVEYLIESISECGKILEKHFPVQADDKNELKDEMDILEK